MRLALQKVAPGAFLFLFNIIIYRIKLNVPERPKLIFPMKTLFVKLLCLVIAVVGVAVLLKRIDNLKEENTRLQNNQTVLLSEKNAIMAECHKYKVSDSLNAYKVSELRLTLEEYKKYRREDLELIKKLKLDKSDMQKVIDTQSETLNSISAPIRDTIIITDTSSQILKIFEHKSKWIDLRGCINLQTDSVNINVNSREALTVVESVEYKRFLGFLWKTKKIKRRDVDVVSQNPNTEIISVDFVSIEQ